MFYTLLKRSICPHSYFWSNKNFTTHINYYVCKFALRRGDKSLKLSTETECQAARFPVHLEEEPDPSKNSTVHWVPKEPSLASWMHLVNGWKQAVYFSEVILACETESQNAWSQPGMLHTLCHSLFPIEMYSIHPPRKTRRDANMEIEIVHPISDCLSSFTFPLGSSQARDSLQTALIPSTVLALWLSNQIWWHSMPALRPWYLVGLFQFKTHEKKHDQRFLQPGAWICIYGPLQTV